MTVGAILPGSEDILDGELVGVNGSIILDEMWDTRRFKGRDLIPPPMSPSVHHEAQACKLASKSRLITSIKMLKYNAAQARLLW
jgi:hypothetical protein